MKIKSFILYSLGLFILLGTACQQQGISSKNIKLETPADSASYAIGVLIGENNKHNLATAPGGDQINVDIMVAAFSLLMHGEEAIMDAETGNTVVRRFFKSMTEKQGQKNLEEGNAFLEKNKTREGVTTTASGLQYEILKQGDGPIPTEKDKVKVHYHGTLIDGTVFDSSVDRGEPATFGVNQVIKGWTEVLQLMPVGSKWKVYIPADLAYGDKPRPGGKIGPNMTLIFDIELLDIVKPEK